MGGSFPSILSWILFHLCAETESQGRARYAYQKGSPRYSLWLWVHKGFCWGFTEVTGETYSHFNNHLVGSQYPQTWDSFKGFICIFLVELCQFLIFFFYLEIKEYAQSHTTKRYLTPFLGKCMNLWIKWEWKILISVSHSVPAWP